MPANNEEEKIRKPYIKSEIIYELELETRAGTPLNANPFDVLNPGN